MPVADHAESPEPAEFEFEPEVASEFELEPEVADLVEPEVSDLDEDAPDLVDSAIEVLTQNYQELQKLTLNLLRDKYPQPRYFLQAETTDLNKGAYEDLQDLLLRSREPLSVLADLAEFSCRSPPVTPSSGRKRYDERRHKIYTMKRQQS